jgi:mRNA-degrading endonuclease toxin of MazEF toxin-antitoxin module
MLVLKNNDALLKMREQMDHNIKVEIKDIDKGIKQVRVEVNTNNKNLHNNNEKCVVMDKINYNTDSKKTPNNSYENGKAIRKVKRQEIWYVDLGKRNGSIQSNVRPFLITSNPVNNKYSTTVNGFPITSKINSKADIPVHVKISNCGLKEESLVLTEQITTIDIRYDLLGYVGTVDDIVMKQVDRARNIQLGDLVEKTPLERLSKEIQDEIHETLQFIYSYEKVLGRSKSNNLNHLLSERSMLLDHLERICKDNGINYKDYYVEYTRERKVSIG